MIEHGFDEIDQDKHRWLSDESSQSEATYAKIEAHFFLRQLTQRQRSVLTGLYLLGKTTAEVASEEHLAPRTIEVIVARVKKKWRNQGK